MCCLCEHYCVRRSICHSMSTIIDKFPTTSSYILCRRGRWTTILYPSRQDHRTWLHKHRWLHLLSPSPLSIDQQKAALYQNVEGTIINGVTGQKNVLCVTNFLNLFTVKHVLEKVILAIRQRPLGVGKYNIIWLLNQTTLSIVRCT